jgi:uncharacterized protein YecT (DUF1311 family)
MRVRAMVVAGALVVAEAASASAPSFDCGRARTTVETTICADAELARLDAALAVSYREALRRVQSDRALLAALRREQSEFLASREWTLDAPDVSLARFLQSWRHWLDAVGGARAGFRGAWINSTGSIEVERRRAGDYTVRAKGDDYIRGSYTCEFIGIGRLKGDRLEVTWDTSENEDDDADGWTLSVRRRGNLLRLEQHRNKSEAATPPFCGARGSLEGEYLPARVLPDPVRAWEAAGDEDRPPSQP